MAKKLGHTVTLIKPSLVPITAISSNEKEKIILESKYKNSLNLCKALQGLSLKNVEIKIKDQNKVLYEDFGEMIFTHFGVGGPIILSASAHLLRYKNIDEKLKQQKIMLYIDLKPALIEEKLTERVLRDFNEYKNKDFQNSLDKLLPK